MGSIQPPFCTIKYDINKLSDYIFVQWKISFQEEKKNAYLLEEKREAEKDENINTTCPKNTKERPVKMPKTKQNKVKMSQMCVVWWCDYLSVNKSINFVLRYK